MSRKGYNYPHGYCPERGSVAKHQLVAEKAFGSRLPAGVVVHHLDYDVSNFKNNNLLICPDEAYHNLIHMRTDAYNSCGHADWLKCYVCKEYDSPEKVKLLRKRGRNVTTFYHAECQRAYKQSRRGM
jgi:hypothetical protein